jgi:hypothetical protein
MSLTIEAIEKYIDQQKELYLSELETASAKQEYRTLSWAGGALTVLNNFSRWLEEQPAA